MIFILFHASFMFGGCFLSMVQVGHKVDGDRSLIAVYDNVDILTSQEEDELVTLFEQVYDKSGMPVMLFTEPYSEYKKFSNKEAFSEDRLYSHTYEENAMAIVYIPHQVGDFEDWIYDFCCGDDTVACLSDAAFDKLLDSFYRARLNMPLADALKVSWNEVMNDLAKTSFEPMSIFVFLFLVFIYGIFISSSVTSLVKGRQAQKYFKEHPEKLDMQPMNTTTPNVQQFQNAQPVQPMQEILLQCPNCGAQNTGKSSKCPYCDSVLTRTR